ncbi:MAG TPA: hypothetical protein VHB21_26655 [Minicystis sp.]|nr:hypothetical protein [Minicystis sp.]
MRWLAVAAAALALAVPARARAQAPSPPASDAYLPLGAFGASVVRDGELDVHVGFSAFGGSSTEHETCPTAGPACASPAPPSPYDVHVAYFAVDVPLDVTYGLSRFVALELHQPLRFYGSSPSYTAGGAPVTEPDDIAHAREQYAGFADAWVALRSSIVRGRFTVTPRLGASLPFGKTIPNPNLAQYEGLWHERTQFGSGTVMPLLGLGVLGEFGKVDVEARAVAIFSLYEDAWGHRAASQLLPSLRAALSMWTTLLPYVEADMPVTGSDHWSNQPPGYGDGRPHASALVGGGLVWTFKAPLYADVNARAHVANIGPGPTYPGTLSIGNGARFFTPREPAEPASAPASH